MTRLLEEARLANIRITWGPSQTADSDIGRMLDQYGGLRI